MHVNVMESATALRPKNGYNVRFVGSQIYRRAAFGKNHPLAYSRISMVMDLCESLGWLSADDILNSPPASTETLERFHAVDYVAALREADISQVVSAEARQAYNFGTMENPVFPGLFERAASTVTGSIMAAEIAAAGGTAFHPSGGTHHGRPDRASGFCYFNDPVFAILTLLDAGKARVLYLDIDAHHGDGVQDGFADDERVWTLSVHEAGRWPNTGAADDRGQCGQARNFAVPRGLNDEEFTYIREAAILPVIERIAPDAVVITCGADALAGDPLSAMALSNHALWDTVQAVVEKSPGTVVLGGGGYNPWTTARCWTGLWGLLSGQVTPESLPTSAINLLEGFECDLVDDDEVEPYWLTTIADPRQASTKLEDVRDEIVDLVHQVMLD